MSYFLSTNVFIEGNKDLRDPQRNAHFKLIESFNQKPETHKIVVLPTGTGKTGLIGLAPFGVSSGRVLIITPGLIIREGISDDFDTRTTYNFWQKRRVIIDDEHLPNVYRYAGFKTPGDKKRVLKNLNEADIVIANIHKVFNTNSKKALINILDNNHFDMIIIDEAHHAEASSWQEALNYFNAEKIVKLTATPWRSDAKELGGEIIYEYELADAIKDGYIKNIISSNYTNEKLEFVVDGQKVDKETALDLMDKAWLSKTVAYSDDCNRTIVDKSIEALNKKRRHGSEYHQIIAVACSINHAHMIKKLYEEANLTVEVVSSDRPEESEQAIIAYKKLQIDVLIHVNMLGEGFDHPNISIAAIFRPFRTMSPYAQFIGRALRWLPNSTSDNIDNIAEVIYHKELGLEELWAYYTGEKEKAERRKGIEREFSESSYEKNLGDVIIDGEIITEVKDFLSIGLVNKYGEAIQEEINKINQEIESQAEKMRQAELGEDLIDDFRKLKWKELDQKVNLRREQKRTELIREELHSRHVNMIIKNTDSLFEETKLDPEGTELVDSTRNVIYKNLPNNIAYVRVCINYNLKRKLKRGIDEWETFDFEMAQSLLPELFNDLEEKIERVKNNYV